MYQIVFDSSAKKQLDKFPQKQRERLILRIKFVASNPFAQLNNATKMQGAEALYRFRVGNLRIIYSLDPNSQKLVVWKIAPRSSVYK